MHFAARERLPVRSSVVTLLIFVVLAAFVAGGHFAERSAAAPAIKDRDPAPNHITGPLATRMDSPVIVLPGESGDGETPEQIVWLVFTRPEQEPEALKGHTTGDRITARGRLGW